VFARSKSNIGPDKGGFEYELEHKAVTDKINASHVTWGKALEGTAEELLATAEAEGPKAPVSNDARAFVLALLKDGPVSAAEVQERAGEAGISYRSVQRAHKTLGGVADKAGMRGGWVWRLPAPSAVSHSREFDEEFDPL